MVDDIYRDSLVGQNFDVFATYFRFVSDTEPPINYHRWCLISAIATVIGRKAYMQHGPFRIFPNLYITLLGEAASRKSTSIKLVKKILRGAGYDKFAADKTSKEKFLLDLEGYVDPLDSGNSGPDKWKIKETAPEYDSVTSNQLWGVDNCEPKEVYIAADEFSEFTGSGNLEFYTTLGNLWDWDDPENPFVQRLKTTRSVSIYQPTINILSGTTPELFSKIFPPEAIGSGFLSRLLLVYGERSGRSIAFPKAPDELLQRQLVNYFTKLAGISEREITRTEEATQILTEIYSCSSVIDDIRFKNYSNRRFTQLIKLCIILTCSRFKSVMDKDIVIEANTILTHAEFMMPKAMGEFGKSKNSDVANKIVQYLEDADFPQTPKQIWTHVSRELDRQASMMEIIQGLILADKIQVVTTQGKHGYLPKKLPKRIPKFVAWKYLTEEELNLAGVIV